MMAGRDSTAFMAGALEAGYLAMSRHDFHSTISFTLVRLGQHGTAAHAADTSPWQDHRAADCQ
jgi:hypothetical protein